MYSFSEKARKDMDEILDYTYDNFGAKAMLDYHLSLRKCFESLAHNPDLGIRAEHVRKSYHCFYHRSHVIFYLSSGKKIQICA